MVMQGRNCDASDAIAHSLAHGRSDRVRLPIVVLGVDKLRKGTLGVPSFQLAGTPDRSTLDLYRKLV